MSDPTGDALAANERVVAQPSEDVWITVPFISSQTDPRFYAAFTSLKSPFGAGGPFEAETRLNLSAYIRHEVASAISAYLKAMEG